MVVAVVAPPRVQPSYQTPPSVPQVAAPAPVLAIPNSDFNTILQRYRTALLDAKATGNTGKQVEADALKAWLDNALVNAQQRLQQSRTTIQSFVDQYAGSTSDIEQVRKAFKRVRDQGPVLQDVYETDKRTLEAPVLKYDPTPIYSKALLIAGVGAVAVLVARRL